MAEARANKRSVNYDIIKIIKNYFKLSSKKEISHDVFIPFIISIVTVSLTFYMKLDVLKILQELNNVIMTVMSILAGFNTASIAIISSSNPSKLIQNLGNQSQRGEGEQLLDSLTGYFSYAIILQLLILIVGLVAAVFLKFIPLKDIESYFYISTIMFGIFVVWFTIVIHSLLVTLRNVSILHNFIIFLGKKFD
ncbi:hypothetical protein [Priestia aryabhattai]